MKERLRNMLSILCALALLIGCLPMSAGADGAVETATVSVQWIDENNRAGARPTQISAVFSVGGSQYSFTLEEANNWTAMIAGVAAGGSWNVQAPDGYTKTQSVKSDGQTIVTLTYQAEPVAVSVAVKWTDNENAKGVRPQSVKARLLADGVPYAAAAPLNSGNGWKNTWNNLPKYRVGTTEEVKYTVEAADSPEFYTMSVSGSAAAGFTLNGTLGLSQLTVSHTVSGLPAGTDLSQITLILSGPDSSLPPTLKLSQLSNGSVTFSDLLPGAYLVQVKNANDLAKGYMLDPANCKLEDALNVAAGKEGTLSTKTSYTPLKPSEELETSGNPDLGSLIFEIYGPDPRTNPMIITYSQFNKNGQYKLEGLVPGTYVICERNAETLVDKYELTVDSITGVAITVTDNGSSRARLFNRYQPMTPAPTPTPTPPPEETPTPSPDTVQIPVTKTWQDNGNADGNRPSSVIVHLYADGQKINSVALNAANNWQYTFTGLAKYAQQSEEEEGEAPEIVYTISEDPVEWYESRISGYHITNVYHPETTSVSVQKVWDDSNNKLRLRPKSIRVTLSNGTTVVLNEGNNWRATVSNLPTRLNGQPAVYTWNEQEVLGYQLTDQKVNDENETVLTNSIWKASTPPPGTPPKGPGTPTITIDDYGTPLGVEIEINHVGDCFD